MIGLAGCRGRPAATCERSLLRGPKRGGAIESVGRGMVALYGSARADLPDWGRLASGSQLPVRVYSTADGLKNNSVNRIVQDSRGFLWFCTSEGVSRFDGYGFVNYGVAEGLGHRRVNDVLESRSGDIWIATGGGLSKLGSNPPPAKVVEETHTPPDARWISRLLEDPHPRRHTPSCGAARIPAFSASRLPTAASNGLTSGIPMPIEGRLFWTSTKIGFTRCGSARTGVSSVIVPARNCFTIRCRTTG